MTFSDICVKGLLALLLVSFPAKAHDHGKADNLANAKNKNGALCCDGKDWSEVLDYRRLENGWRIQLVNKRWVDARKHHRRKPAQLGCQSLALPR